MKTKENEILFDLAENLNHAIHFNSTVTMAVDFLIQTCSRESVEAIQTVLDHQKKLLENIYEGLENLRINDNSSDNDSTLEQGKFPLNSTFPQEQEEGSAQKAKS